MRVVVVLLLASLLTPAASAQSLEPRLKATVKEHVGLIEPDTAVAEHLLTVDVTCPIQREPNTEWRLRWDKVSTPPYATAVFDPSSVAFKFDETKCVEPAYVVSKSSKLYITVNRDAPAFEQFITKVKATVEQREVKNSTTMDVSTTIGYFPLTQVNPGQLFLKVPPGEKFQFSVDVYNIGNGDTRVTFEVLPTGKNKLANVTTPDAIILQSKTAGASARNQATTHVNVTAPAGDLYMNAIFSFMLKVRSMNAQARPAATDETSITFSVQVQGTGGAAPGPESTLVLAVVALAFLGFARRRSSCGRP